jgi:hypothetical protein
MRKGISSTRLLLSNLILSERISSSWLPWKVYRFRDYKANLRSLCLFQTRRFLSLDLLYPLLQEHQNAYHPIKARRLFPLGCFISTCYLHCLVEEANIYSPALIPAKEGDPMLDLFQTSQYPVLQLLVYRWQHLLHPSSLSSSNRSH